MKGRRCMQGHDYTKNIGDLFLALPKPERDARLHALRCRIQRCNPQMTHEEVNAAMKLAWESMQP
jgi:hypothetical protein